MRLGEPSPRGVESGKGQGGLLQVRCSKKTTGGNSGSPLNGPGDLLTKNIEKALKLLSAWFALAFAGKICLWLRYTVPCGNNTNVCTNDCIINLNRVLKYSSQSR